MSNRYRTGLHPVRMKNGKPYHGIANAYFIPSSDSNKYYIGQPVTVIASGNSAEIQGTSGGPVIGATGMPVGSLRTVGQTTAGDGNRITGIIVGIGADPDDNGRAPYRKASTTSIVFVQDDAEVVYEVSTSAAASTFSVADLGKNGNLQTTTTGTDATGISLCTLHSTLAADASNQVRIVGLSRDPGKNDLASANVTFEVVLNNVTEDTVDVLGVA